MYWEFGGLGFKWVNMFARLFRLNKVCGWTLLFVFVILVFCFVRRRMFLCKLFCGRFPLQNNICRIEIVAILVILLDLKYLIVPLEKKEKKVIIPSFKRRGRKGEINLFTEALCLSRLVLWQWKLFIPGKVFRSYGRELLLSKTKLCNN